MNETLNDARCLACEDGVPLVNVTADRPDLPDTWTHQYGGEPGTISPCRAAATAGAPAIHFTAVDHEAECIREALRKLDTVELRASDPDPAASRAFEALGYLLTTIRRHEAKASR